MLDEQNKEDAVGRNLEPETEARIWNLEALLRKRTPIPPLRPCFSLLPGTAMHRCNQLRPRAFSRPRARLP
jgi:hypothetical protein